MDFSLINWAAVAAGTVAAYLLGMLWFSPKLFGESWAAGSHNIQPPAAPPMAAMIVQFLGTLALAMVVGITETTGAIVAAIMAIVATALIVAGMGLFSQKTAKAAVIDASYIVVSGVLMILAQGIL